MKVSESEWLLAIGSLSVALILGVLFSFAVAVVAVAA